MVAGHPLLRRTTEEVFYAVAMTPLTLISFFIEALSVFDALSNQIHCDKIYRINAHLNFFSLYVVPDSFCFCCTTMIKKPK